MPFIHICWGLFLAEDECILTPTDTLVTIYSAWNTVTVISLTKEPVLQCMGGLMYYFDHDLKNTGLTG